MKYMLDTNIASFYIKGKSALLDKKMAMVNPNELCISIITQAELYYGLEKVGYPVRLTNLVEKFLSQITILDWGDNASRHYAIVRADLEKQGKVIGNMDMLISAHALAENLTLITNNTREFSRVKGLSFQDWTV